MSGIDIGINRYTFDSTKRNNAMTKKLQKAMKTEPNESGPRNEYFDQLMDKAADWHETPFVYEGLVIKEKILSVSYDKCMELERRVEELETALKWSTELLQESAHWIDKITSVGTVNVMGNIDIQVNENINLLTPKS